MPRLTELQQDTLAARRKAARLIEDPDARKEALRKITVHEDALWGEEQSISGVRVPYGSSTEQAQGVKNAD